MLTSQGEEEDYEKKIRKIFKDLVYHTIKNKPKNIVSNFLLYLNQPKYMVKYLIKKRDANMTDENKYELQRLKESINKYKDMEKFQEEKNKNDKEDMINNFNNNQINGELNKELGEKAKYINELNNKIEEHPNENEEVEYEEVEEEVEVTEEIEVDEDQLKNLKNIENKA